MFLNVAAAEVVQSRHLMSEELASLNLAEYPATHQKQLRQRRKRFTSCKMNFSKLDRLSKWKALNGAWKLRWLHFRSLKSRQELLNVAFQSISWTQSYEIKSPPWTILWFRILRIFSVESIARLYVSNFRQVSSALIHSTLLSSWLLSEVWNIKTPNLFIFSTG